MSPLQPRVQGLRPTLAQPHPMVVHEEEEDDGDIEERVEERKSVPDAGDSIEAQRQASDEPHMFG